MSKKKEKFINKLELFYRNFGSDWTLDDFSTKEEEHSFYLKCLLELEAQQIVTLDADQKSFKITDLPSKYFSEK